MLLFTPITSFTQQYDYGDDYDYLYDYTIYIENEKVIEKENYNVITIDARIRVKDVKINPEITVYPHDITVVDHENGSKYFVDTQECNIPVELKIIGKEDKFTVCYKVPKESKRFDAYIGKGLFGPLHLNFKSPSPTSTPEEILKDLPVTDSIQIILNQQSFSENDTIKVYGKIPEIKFGTMVSIEVISPDNNLAYVDQMNLQGKLFSFEIPIGANVKKAGTYTVRATYDQNQDSYETSFYFQGTNKTLDPQIISTINKAPEKNGTYEIFSVVLMIVIIGTILGVIMVKNKKKTKSFLQEENTEDLRIIQEGIRNSKIWMLFNAVLLVGGIATLLITEIPFVAIGVIIFCPYSIVVNYRKYLKLKKYMN